MINTNTLPFELSIIQAIQTCRAPWLDQLFICLNFFDTHYFYLLLIPAIWALCGQRWGVRLFYLMMINFAVNNFFKEFFMSPRPFHLDPSVGLVHVSFYGFPSGGAQAAALLAGLLISNNRRSIWAWLLGLTYFATISFSRLYLGAHFPRDILGGWLLGLIILAFAIKLLPHIEDYLIHKTQRLHLLLGLILPTLFLLLSSAKVAQSIVATTMAFSIALFSTIKTPQKKPTANLKKRILNGLIAVGLFLPALYLLPQLPIPIYLSSFLVGFWLPWSALLPGKLLDKQKQKR